MVSKCANPACSAQLHYLHEGKIFRFDIEAASASAQRAADPAPQSDRPTQLRTIASGNGKLRREYFWLCRSCLAEMTLAVQNGEVVVRPLYLSDARSRAAS